MTNFDALIKKINLASFPEIAWRGLKFKILFAILLPH